MSLSLFFALVRELEDLGKDGYGYLQVFEYLALLVPARVVEFLPLAALLGCIMSLGALAGNSEIIAMQASGVSFSRLLISVLQAGIGLALVSFALSEWVVPDSSTNAREVQSSTVKQGAALRSRQGVWIKDGSRVIHIGKLFPNGFARDVVVYQLDSAGKLESNLHAQRAEPVENGWELQQIEFQSLDPQKTSNESFDKLHYSGDISHELLQVLLIKPSRMSRRDLHAYLKFLDENRLEAKAERLIFWQKVFAPLTIFVMCLLAIPFILGAQRQSSNGYRLLIGILLGLSFAVLNRLLTQLGSQFEFNAVFVAMAPNVLFFAVAGCLLQRKLSY